MARHPARRQSREQRLLVVGRTVLPARLASLSKNYNKTASESGSAV